MLSQPAQQRMESCRAYCAFQYCYCRDCLWQLFLTTVSARYPVLHGMLCAVGNSDDVPRAKLAGSWWHAVLAVVVHLSVLSLTGLSLTPTTRNMTAT